MLLKHHKNQDHGVAMAKWIAFNENVWRKTSWAKHFNDKRREGVQQNREHLRVLMECLMFTHDKTCPIEGIVKMNMISIHHWMSVVETV